MPTPAPAEEAVGQAVGVHGPMILPQATITIPEIDISALTSVPADLAAPPVQPETPPAPIPAETPKAEAGDAAAQGNESKPVAALTPQAEAEAYTDAALPPTAKPDVLPEIDLSALRSVPADLTTPANPSSQPGRAEPFAGGALPTSLPSSQADPAEPVADAALPTSKPSAAGKGEGSRGPTRGRIPGERRAGNRSQRPHRNRARTRQARQSCPRRRSSFPRSTSPR